MNVSTRLRSLRESAAMSQAQVARAVGKSQAWLSNVEAGYTEPQDSEIKAIEQAIAPQLRKRRQEFDRVLSRNTRKECLHSAHRKLALQAAAKPAKVAG